jgi:hypothetical protein
MALGMLRGGIGAVDGVLERVDGGDADRWRRMGAVAVEVGAEWTASLSDVTRPSRWRSRRLSLGRGRPPLRAAAGVA